MTQTRNRNRNRRHSRNTLRHTRSATRARRAHTRRQNRASRGRRTRRGGVKNPNKARTTTNARSYVHPYSRAAHTPTTTTTTTTTPTHASDIERLDALLSQCKNTEASLIGKANKANKAKCKHGESCTHANPEHFREFSHPQSSQPLARPFKMCADRFIDLSYRIFNSYDHSFPTEWYVVVAEHLRETDYTRYDSLYFNILANLCIHHQDFVAQYPDKQFWQHLYMGMEEGAAVTGMYDVTNIPVLSKCLVDMASPDTRYLSNTALIFSKTYGKDDDEDEDEDDGAMSVAD